MSSLAIYTIYNRPSDYPGHYVARRHVADPHGSRPTDWLEIATTLDGIRALLPPGLCRIPRHASDDICIVESWL